MRQLIWWAALALILGACDGVILDPSGSPAASGDVAPGRGDVGADTLACAPGAPAVGHTGIRRLTGLEYRYIVEDLLGIVTDVSSTFSEDSTASGFESNAEGGIDATGLDQYSGAAHDLATQAIARLPELLPCDPSAAGEDVCARALIRTFGARAYRRPLDDEQVERYASLFTTARSELGLDFANSARIVLEAFLQAPQFLFHVEDLEPAEPGASVARLSPHGVAAALSNLLWRSIPDDALFAAARAGELETVDGVEAQVRRMLDDERADRMLVDFHEQWLQIEPRLEKDPDAFPELTAELEASMRREFRAMVAADPLRLGTLLTTTTSSVDGQLGELYGVPDVSGAEPEHVELDAAERAGILTLPLLLASHSSYHDASITLRGVFVRERVLCHELPSPPPGVPTELPSDPTLTRRQQVEQHTQDPACAPCHTLIDPIGLGFEHYDAIGRYHDETADGRPVDALGELTHTGDSDGTFDGAIELAHRFAASERVRDCYAKQWFVYALGRHPSMEDRCSLARVTEAFVDGGADVRELVVAVATSDAFLYRQVATGEER